MVNDSKISKRVIFSQRSSNYLCTCSAKSSLARSLLAFIFNFSRFFKKYLTKNIFFFLVGIIIFDIIVMRLVENTGRIMIAVRIFVSYSSHLVLELGLRRHSPNSNSSKSSNLLILCIQHWSISQLGLVSSLWSKILTSQQKHLLMETTNNRDLRLLRLLLLLLYYRVCCVTLLLSLILRIDFEALLLVRLTIKNLWIPCIVAWVHRAGLHLCILMPYQSSRCIVGLLVLAVTNLGIHLLLVITEVLALIFLSPVYRRQHLCLLLHWLAKYFNLILMYYVILY